MTGLANKLLNRCNGWFGTVLVVVREVEEEEEEEEEVGTKLEEMAIAGLLLVLEEAGKLEEEKEEEVGGSLLLEDEVIFKEWFPAMLVCVLPQVTVEEEKTLGDVPLGEGRHADPICMASLELVLVVIETATVGSALLVVMVITGGVSKEGLL